MKVIMIILAFIFSLDAAEKELYVYNWSEYMPESVLKDFTKETGIKVHYTTYDSNEEMYEKVKSGGYDIIVPSTYFINRMGREGLLMKLDKNKLSNFPNLDQKLLYRQFDPQNDYSVPYLWGTTGLSYNSALVESDVNSWSDLWDSRYKNSILVNDDVRDVFGMALKVLGHSSNSTDPKEIEEAYKKLLELKPNIKLYYSGSQKEIYLKEKVKLGISFNGEGFMAKEDNQEAKITKLLFEPEELTEKEEKKEIMYVYPKEGALVWMDSLAIPQGAKNVENAHAFINYLLKPEVSKTISQTIGYASPNLKTLELLDKATRTNRIIYPTKADLNNAEFQIDVGDALSIYEKYWKMLKAE